MRALRARMRWPASMSRGRPACWCWLLRWRASPAGLRWRVGRPGGSALLCAWHMRGRALASVVCQQAFASFALAKGVLTKRCVPNRLVPSSVAARVSRKCIIDARQGGVAKKKETDMSNLSDVVGAPACGTTDPAPACGTKDPAPACGIACGFADPAPACGSADPKAAPAWRRGAHRTGSRLPHHG